MEKLNETPHAGVRATVAGHHILLRLPKDPGDIRFIRSLGHARWDTTAFCWVLGNHPANVKKLNDYFGARVLWSESVPDPGKPAMKLPAMEPGVLKVVRLASGRLRLRFAYHKALVALIKQQPFPAWDPASVSWTLPHTEKTLLRLKDFCTVNQWKFDYEDQADDRLARPRPSSLPKTRHCPEAYLEKLRVLRYSPRTLQVYRDCFTEFLNYFPGKEPLDITQEEVFAYLHYLVDERRISTSYQNQAINAIKFYFEKVAGGKRQTYYIERPRQEKFLPSVLSEGEVRAVIAAIANIKHKCMIMTAYSAGLRVSELLNLRVGDIDSGRMLIRVVMGKGKKDRVTLLSVKLLEMLREYYRMYRPQGYLFEGVTGGRYAERSIQNVLRRACAQAGIQKHVTMHTLRHSFATHLLEHNTDLRYIQELLGHANPKTTQIYTHITTKGLDQLKSPLDHLDL